MLGLAMNMMPNYEKSTTTKYGENRGIEAVFKEGWKRNMIQIASRSSLGLIPDVSVSNCSLNHDVAMRFMKTLSESQLARSLLHTHCKASAVRRGADDGKRGPQAHPKCRLYHACPSDLLLPIKF